MSDGASADTQGPIIMSDGKVENVRWEIIDQLLAGRVFFLGRAEGVGVGGGTRWGAKWLLRVKGWLMVANGLFTFCVVMTFNGKSRRGGRLTTPTKMF